MEAILPFSVAGASHLSAKSTCDPDSQTISEESTPAALTSIVPAIGYKTASEPFLQKIRALIEDKLSEDLPIEELAKGVFYTRVQVYRKIKTLTGQSPSRFVRTVRLQKALELLVTTDFSIAEIAYEVGFRDPKYFTRVFTAEFGKAPSAFIL